MQQKISTTLDISAIIKVVIIRCNNNLYLYLPVVTIYQSNRTFTFTVISELDNLFSAYRPSWKLWY